LSDIHSQQLLLCEWRGGEGAASVSSTSGLHSDSGHGSRSASTASPQLHLPCFPGTQAITYHSQPAKREGRSWMICMFGYWCSGICLAIASKENTNCSSCGHQLTWGASWVWCAEACAHWQAIALCRSPPTASEVGEPVLLCVIVWSEGLLEPLFRRLRS